MKLLFTIFVFVVMCAVIFFAGLRLLSKIEIPSSDTAIRLESRCDENGCYFIRKDVDKPNR